MKAKFIEVEIKGSTPTGTRETINVNAIAHFKHEGAGTRITLISGESLICALTYDELNNVIIEELIE